jgi:hypothetical protein
MVTNHASKTLYVLLSSLINRGEFCAFRREEKIKQKRSKTKEKKNPLQQTLFHSQPPTLIKN